MQIGGAGTQAAQQLMQATSSVQDLAVQQMTAVSTELESKKDSALQNTARQMSQSVDRKGTMIDTMA